MTPYAEIDGCVIYHADARDVLQPGALRVAATVCSPPYNVAVDYADHDDTMAWEAYRDLAAGVAAGIAAVQPHGRTWVNVTPTVPTVPIPAGGHSGRASNRRESLLAIWDTALRSNGHQPWDYVAWAIPGRGPGCAWGSWESPAAPNLRGEWEVVIAAHTGPTWARHTPDEFQRRKDTVGDWTSLTTNLWRIRPETRGPRTGHHPAPFPTTLAARCIRLSSWPGEVVLDPFMGSGTTVLSARALGRRAVGIDVSERYCESTARRLAQGVFDFGGAA